MTSENLLLLTDSYKASHYLQYPPKTTKVYSYFESRGGDFRANVFFGLQCLIKKYLVGPVVNEDKIDQAYTFFEKHFGQNLFNVGGWHHIVKKHYGYLPIRIKAVPEGTVVPTGNVLITIENTDPECYWLTNYLETLLVQTWYPTTVATQSWYMKQSILDSLELSGDPTLVDFKLHDFGFRGVSSVETAGIGGMAHLVNFLGTDTVEGIVYAQRYYHSDMCGFSIPASEHSTITSWGKINEGKAFKNMLTQYPTGLVACVSDSYDIYNACEKLWGEDLHLDIIKREGTLVIRPDSGNPLEVLHRILKILAQKFGYTTNAKGYNVLNPKVRVIQGDGIDYDTMEEILYTLTTKGWSSDNITFGSGGGLLQKLNRDTCKFAFKCSNAVVNNEDIEVYKEPVTDKGKRSKAGELSLVKINGTNNSFTFRTIKQKEKEAHIKDELETVFENGSLLVDHKFSDVRERALNTGHAVKEFERL